MDKIILPKFNDMHCHFRLDPLLSEVLPQTVRYARFAVAMPNTRPKPIRTGEDAIWYQHQIFETIGSKFYLYPNFTPLMTIEITDETTPMMIVAAHQCSVFAGKAYPRGVTTNSDGGITNFFSPKILETFREMEELGMPLLIHSEIDKPRTLVTEWEDNFLLVGFELAEKFPNLKIVFEHLTTKKGVDLIRDYGNKNTAATITPHHLVLTLNDVIGYGIRPHNACMPMPKTFEDREALIEAATSGHPRIFLGSDTAPHHWKKKECTKGACGIYNAPVVPELLAQIFEEAGALDRLGYFTSGAAADFYNLPKHNDTITLVKKEWAVPVLIGNVVPFLAGTKLQWQLKE